MSEVLMIKAEDAKGNLIKEFELELPTEFGELASLPGEAKALTMVRNQMKITARATYKTHKGKPSIFPKGTQKEIRDALKSGDMTEEDLLAFIASRRTQK
jgi:hypothetical protein